MANNIIIEIHSVSVKEIKKGTMCHCVKV
jgi:hypothetical protein